MGRNTGARSPVRAIASWIVATPYLLSSATLAAGARSIFLTAIPDVPIMLPPISVSIPFDYHVY
jgi:hypothetical protein